MLQSPWLPGAQLPKGSTSELSWIEAMVVTAGSKARNSSLQALLDFDYMVGRRPAGFAEKSWFALKPLPRRAFPAIFAVLRKTDATVTVLSTGLKVGEAVATAQRLHYVQHHTMTQSPCLAATALASEPDCRPLCGGGGSATPPSPGAVPSTS